MAELNDVPTRWREEDPLSSPEARARNTRLRWTFGLAVAAAALVGAVVVFLSWLRPLPHPETATLWLGTPPGLPAPVWAAGDREGLTHNPLFASSDSPAGGLDREGLTHQLADLGSRPRAGVLIVYLAGYAERRGGEVQLLVSEGEPTPLRDVLRALASSPARRKLLLLDLAAPPADLRRGLLGDDMAAAVPDDLEAVPDAGRVVMLVCAAKQTPCGVEDLQRSAFSYYLDRGLRGAADGAVDGARDGVVTARELTAYVRERVERWAAHNRGVRQTPEVYGLHDDFAVVSAGAGSAVPAPEERPTAYPDWLRDAWKVRQQLLDGETYRDAPAAFHLTDALLLDAERAWFEGTDKGQGADTLKADLARLEKRRVPPPTPDAPSLGAQTAQGRKPDAKAVEAVRAAIDAERLTPAGPAPAAPAIPPDTLAALKDRSAFDVASAIFDAAAEDAEPRADRIKALDAVLRTQQPEPQFAETALLRRLSDMAARSAAWPAGTVRRVLETARTGELVSGDWEAAQVRKRLDAAAGRRHEGETLLLACHGYASTEEADRELVEAAKAYDVCKRSLDAAHRARKILDRARAFLPAYTPYLEWAGASDKEWEQAVAAACELASRLDAAEPAEASAVSRRDDELGRAADDMEAALDRLSRPFTADGLAKLRERLRRPQVQPSVLVEADAVLATPFPSAEERAALWEAARALTHRLHDETARLDEEDDRRHAAIPQSLAGSSQAAEPSPAVLRRARASLALLRLGGLSASDLQPSEVALASAEAAAAEAGKFAPASEALAAELRRAWTGADARLHDASQEAAMRERLSWVWLPAGPAADGVDGLTFPQAEVRAQRLQESAEQRADQARYESRDLAALGALPDWLARFHRNVARGRPSRKPDYAIDLLADPAAVRFGPTDAGASTNLDIRGPGNAEMVLRFLEPAGRWFDLTTPGLTPDADGSVRLPAASSVRVPLRIGLHPGHDAAPAPAGVTAEARVGGRVYHRLIPVSVQAVTDRLEVFVSADPAGAVALDELRLRPINRRQTYSLFVRNLSARTRNLIVRLADASGPIQGGEVKLSLHEHETLPVHFAAGPPAPKAAAAPPPAAPAPPAVALEAEAPELKGPLEVRLLDADAPDAAAEVRQIPVEIAAAAEYTLVTGVRFLPARGETANRLTVTIKAAPGLSGPPCPVELVLPGPGGDVRKVKKGTFQGELPDDGGELTLFAEDVPFGPGAEEAGLVYLTVDGRPRAYVFRTTFVRSGDAVTAHPEKGPALRLQAPHAAPAGPHFEVGVEVDDAPPGATLEVGLGQLRDGRFDADEVRRFPSAQNSRIGIRPAGADGALSFEAAVHDWVAVFDARRMVGRRTLRARLLARDGAEIRTAFQPVSLDDAAPEGLSFVDPPKRARKDGPLPLTATARSASGVAHATFFLGKPTADNKTPPGAAAFAARATDADRTIWTAVLPLKAEKAGPIDVSVEAVNAAGLSSFATTTVDLTDADPNANDPGRIEGAVLEGSLPQPGLDVVLRDDKGAEKQRAKTTTDGKFIFEKVPPGPYALTVEKSATKRYGAANVTVEAGKTAAGVEIKLLMR